MKAGRFVIVAAICIAIGLGWYVFYRRGHGHEKPLALRIQFTCDVRGRLVPCGCFTGQLGGLTRIATMFGDRSGPGNIRLDVGDALESATDYHRIEYQYILQAFASMGYAAVNMGPREATLGAAQLRELHGKSPVPMISANLMDVSTGAPILERYRLLEIEGWQIAVVGVVDPRKVGDTAGAGVRVERMETALGRVIPQLKGKADAIVLLAMTDEATLHSLAREFYELSVILGGAVTQPAQQLESENQSSILYVTNQSRAVGTLDATLIAPSKLKDPMGDVSLVREQYPQEPNIQKLSRDYRAAIKSTKLDVDDPDKLSENVVPGVKSLASYTGSESCLACHPTAGTTWQHSRHSHAFETLKAANADSDPNCIQCHTVGFGSATGYRREFGSSRFVSVGCESCHGAGSAHVAARQKGDMDTGKFRPLGAGDCQKCHHGEFSRPFDWDKFWPVIMHRKEGAGK